MKASTKMRIQDMVVLAFRGHSYGAIAEKYGLSKDHVSRLIRSPHGRAYRQVLYDKMTEVVIAERVDFLLHERPQRPYQTLIEEVVQKCRN